MAPRERIALELRNRLVPGPRNFCFKPIIPKRPLTAYTAFLSDVMSNKAVYEKYREQVTAEQREKGLGTTRPTGRIVKKIAEKWKKVKLQVASTVNISCK
jgi:hypothetical protein